MFDLKTNSKVLEDVLIYVKEHYGNDLCQFIRMTLRRGYEQRPSTLQLVDLPYIQKCLQLNDSALYKGLEGGCGYMLDQRMGVVGHVAEDGCGYRLDQRVGVAIGYARVGIQAGLWYSCISYQFLRASGYVIDMSNPKLDSDN